MPSATAVATPSRRVVTEGGNPWRPRPMAGAPRTSRATARVLAGCGERVPAGAEGGRAVAVGASGRTVPLEEVQRAAGIGELGCAVGSGGPADEGLRHPAADLGVGTRGGVRRPRCGAGAGAVRRGSLVGVEGIEGEASTVGQDGAQRSLPNGQRGATRCRCGSLRRARRGVPVRGTAGTRGARRPAGCEAEGGRSEKGRQSEDCPAPTTLSAPKT